MSAANRGPVDGDDVMEEAARQSATETILVPPEEYGGPNTRSLAAFTRLQEEARAYVASSKAHNTRRAYASDWADFTQWCRLQGLPPLPTTPETVALT